MRVRAQICIDRYDSHIESDRVQEVFILYKNWENMYIYNFFF